MTVQDLRHGHTISPERLRRTRRGNYMLVDLYFFEGEQLCLTTHREENHCRILRATERPSSVAAVPRNTKSPIQRPQKQYPTPTRPRGHSDPSSTQPGVIIEAVWTSLRRRTKRMKLKPTKIFSYPRSSGALHTKCKVILMPVASRTGLSDGASGDLRGRQRGFRLCEL
ncbi:Hypothetical predicted protein [Xyrichtys novacula]|uniref:Uncharacterized protein n=1 Tax=Xyrichtys novacula TaxID=13765 RepID=A0AAV1H3R5_XYRNO|nr:Hypothetical predicted protein [Xyrichtys novacula]